MKVDEWTKIIGAAIALITFGWSVWIRRDGILREQNDRKAALEQSKMDLRWRQTVEAQATIRRLTDDKDAKTAMTILDWNGRHFELRSGRREKISWQLMREALRTDPGRFTPVEVFVRDSFDALFDKFQMIGQQIDNKLFLDSDVRYSLQYYSSRINDTRNWPVFSGYLDAYHFERAKSLIEAMSINDPKIDLDIEAVSLIDEQDLDIPTDTGRW